MQLQFETKFFFSLSSFCADGDCKHIVVSSTLTINHQKIDILPIDEVMNDVSKDSRVEIGVADIKNVEKSTLR